MQSHSTHAPEFALLRSTQIVVEEIARNQTAGFNPNLALSCLCLLLLVAFAAQPLNGSVTPRYAYVVDPGSGTILEYTIGLTNGALSPITLCPSTPDPGANGPSAAVVDRNGAFLYVANQLTGTIWSYPISPSSGCLGSYTQYSLNSGAQPVSLAITGHDAFLFVLDSTGYIDVFSISNGTLTANTSNPFPTTPGCGSPASTPSAMVVDPYASYIYVANDVNTNPGGVGNVCTFTYATDGTPSVVAFTYLTSGADPSYLALDPVGQFLYVTSYSTTTPFPGYVDAFPITPAGGSALGAANTALPGNGTRPAGVAASPFGQVAFVAVPTTNRVDGYLINPTTGALTYNAFKLTHGGPAAVAIDPTGNYFYVVNITGTISGYKILDNSGFPAPISGSPFSAGTAPVAIAVQP
jgi:6-phosphogluconolactonase